MISNHHFLFAGVKKMDSYKTALASLPGYLISKFQWGCPYIHIAIVDYIDDEGIPLVWEALENGVVYHKLEDRPFDLFYLEAKQVEIYAVKKWLIDQIGKPYDYFGLIGFLWRREYQNDNKWFCSELAAEALKQGGVASFNFNILKSWQVTPREFLTICKGPLKQEDV